MRYAIAESLVEFFLLWKAQIHGEPLTQNEAFHAANFRPKKFRRLSSEERWAIDKRLGILDWDGPGSHDSATCAFCRFHGG